MNWKYTPHAGVADEGNVEAYVGSTLRFGAVAVTLYRTAQPSASARSGRGVRRPPSWLHW